MIEQSDSIAKLSFAMVAASAELKNPPKDSINPHFKSRFADLATVLDTVKPTLTKHKLAVLQFPAEVAGQPAMATMLVHESGEWIRSAIPLCPAKNDPQGLGSAQTYARRYGLQAVLGITADDDDDGNAASQPKTNNQQQPAKTQGTPQGLKVPTNEELKAALTAKGWTWAQAVADINVNDKQNYPTTAKPTDIKMPHLSGFYKWLIEQPDVKAAN